jgi:hypothetical protein
VLPLELQNLIDESERYIEQGALHHLDHFRRKSIYDAIALLIPDKVQKVYTWLDILSAQKVLPIFTNTVKENELPTETTTVAINVAQNNISKASAEWHYDKVDIHKGYNWGYSYLPVNVECAAEAAVLALKTSLGYYPLTNITGFSNRKLVTNIDVWQDSNARELFANDAALAACLALAYVPTQENEARVLPYLSSENRMVLGIPKQELCNPELMLQFWKWWLLEAIPKAYKLSADWD